MYSAIAANKRKTYIIMFLFVLIITGLGWAFSYIFGGNAPSVTIGVLIGALIYTVISYYSASKLALAVNGAKKIEQKDNPRLYRIVENIAITEGLPTPEVYIMEDAAPNAFATGRDPNHAAVCATTGLLEIMDDSELQGVMAHEMGHIKNYDSRVGMIAFAMVAVIGLLADVLLRMTFFSGDDNNSGSIGFFLGIAGAILAPLAAILIQSAISRQREYLADATGVMATRYPEGLASALEKIRDHGSALKSHQNSSTAHLFFANPLKGKAIGNLFSTHPPIDQRIARIREIGYKA